VGNLYFFGGLGIPKDMHEGFLWFQKSAEQQNVDSLSQLAEIYKTGQGTEMNLLQARYATDSARAIKRRKEIAGIAMNGKGAPLATMGNIWGTSCSEDRRETGSYRTGSPTKRRF
jgi:TPR repeat protein